MDPRIQNEVFKFFEGNGGIPGNTEPEKLACEYLDLHVVDSIGIVQMIVTFEKEFDIRFSPSHMQSAEFKTVGGLIGLIEKMVADQHRTS